MIVRKISALLRAAAESILDGDVDRSLAVLRDARSTDELVSELRAAADEGLSVRTLLAVPPPAPRPRARDGRAGRAAGLRAAQHPRARAPGRGGRATATSRSRASYAALLDDLADVHRRDRRGARAPAGRPPPSGTSWSPSGRATGHVERTSELSAEVVLAQVRSLIADLLAVTGMDPLAATDQIPPLPS